MPAPYSRYAVTFVSSAARTTTATSSACYMPDDIVGGTFLVNCSSVGSSTTHTLDIGIMVTPDDGTTTFGVANFTQITAASKRYMNVSFVPFLQAGSEGACAVAGSAVYANFPISRKFYFYWTIGGTSPSITFSISFVGYRLASIGSAL
jgi:hypothetical protein